MNNLEIMEQLDRIEKLLRGNKSVLSLEEACQYTGISRSYLYKLTSTRKIPFSKPRGKMIYFCREKLDQWLLSNERKSEKEIKAQAIDYAFRTKRKL